MASAAQLGRTLFVRWRAPPLCTMTLQSLRPPRLHVVYDALIPILELLDYPICSCVNSTSHHLLVVCDSAENMTERCRNREQFKQIMIAVKPAIQLYLPSQRNNDGFIFSSLWSNLINSSAFSKGNAPRRKLARWRYDYNTRRPHFALNGRAPASARRALELSEGPTHGALADAGNMRYATRGLSN